MIKYFEHKQINKQRWDDCISSSPQGIVYALSWYIDIVSPDWDALIEDDYKSVFPLTKRMKVGIDYLYQPYFTQQLGLFTNDINVSEKKLSDFLSEIPHNFRLIEIQLNAGNNLNQVNDFSIIRRLTHHLDLSGSYEKISSEYSENLRRNIKKAQKSTLEISKIVSPNDIISLFRINRGAGIQNLKTHDYETLKKLLIQSDNKKLLDCRGVNNTSGKLIAGAIFLKSIHSYIFLFSATNEEAKETGAMSLIIDSFIKDHSQEIPYLDFEGSMDVNLARYYKSFGSKEIVYLQIRRNKLPFILRWLK